jgi:hypothetical protein
VGAINPRRGRVLDDRREASVSVDLIVGICGVVITTMVVIAMVLIVPSNTEPAYDPARHPDGTDHGAPARAEATTLRAEQAERGLG